jgi:type I restriction enzyme S subunit
MNIDREGKIDLSVTKFVSTNKDRRRLAVGDVLFNNTNSPELVGKTAAVSVAGDFAFSNHMTRIRFADNVLPKFGALQLHFLWMRGDFKYNCVKHVNQASVSSRALARGVPFVWAPPPEQERIVAELEKQFSRLDEAVANLKRVKANLKRYKAAVLKAAVEGRLVPTEAELAHCEGRNYETGVDLLQRIFSFRRRQWTKKGKYEEPTQPDSLGLPQLSEGWCWARLDAVASIKGGITVDRKRQDPTARPVPYLRVANVQRGYLDLEEIKSIDAPEVEIEELRLMPGDILFNEGGDRDKLGRGWIWEGQLPSAFTRIMSFERAFSASGSQPS